MKVEIEEKEGCLVDLKVSVEHERVAQEFTKSYKKLVPIARIPGFRPGRAPRHLLERHFGSQVKREVLESLVNDTYKEAVSEANISPACPPEISQINYNQGEPLTFTATLEVIPKISLDYKGTSIEKKVHKVLPSKIEDELARLQNKHAQTIPVEDRPVQMGDILNIDFEGRGEKDSLPFVQKKEAELELGVNSLLPGAEGQLMGMKIDEEKEILVTIPEHYPAYPPMAGKKAIFKVKLHEIREKEIPELDDEFAKDVGKYETLEELKAEIKTNLEKAAEAEAGQNVQNDLLTLLSSKIDFPLPKTMIEGEKKLLLDAFAKILALNKGITLVQYMQEAGVTEEELERDYETKAIERLKKGLLIDYVAKEEKIEVSPKALETEIKNLAQYYNREFDEMKAYLEKEEKINEIKERLRTEKVVDFLVQASEVNRVEVEE
ncbi:MAG: trigger factor [bacterium]|nr:trigger factor [bacterium]